ncbi:two-component system NtrC family response regulator [Sinobacterium caligoides]|uniref:Two-component system NtrC family response regulator n=1 Tax=Sinobacterium caligoides TaxID=933926 RepID=A0A3N2D4Z7_9GAMM|nr:PEP-CTERM-box response regulator transcription factor [Sinobacterium caligoides]ROR94850.1 two-component system NtrC family response regulator [Sinobacterium caligoides]
MNKNNSKPTLLIVEDDIGLQSQLRWHFDSYNVVLASDRPSAIAAIRKEEPAVVVQDLGLPPDEEGVEEGFATVRETLALAPNTKIIVVTGHHERENALRAVDLGAYDFYEKPVNTEALDLIVNRAFHIYNLEEQNRKLHSQSTSTLNGLIASDPAMLRICQTIEKIAPTNITSLLLGESGTGKEVLAKAIHESSPRREERFIAINCAAVPEALMESELFGHERGAFTGANKTTPGKVETAHHGTLFLDEIGDMPLPLQAKLLRFLQEREIERVGGRETIAVDVRVVCATNKDLESMVSSGDFREDLYYRISEMVINIPPLRERSGDKILLARFLLQRFSEEQSRNITSYSNEATAAIESYNWPGNIRELENKIRRAVIMCEGKKISAADLCLETTKDLSINLRKVRYEAEKQAINKALYITAGNISAAAKLLGITRPTLYDLVKKYEIQIPNSPMRTLASADL